MQSCAPRPSRRARSCSLGRYIIVLLLPSVPLAGPDHCLYISVPAGLHCYDGHACNVNRVPRHWCCVQAVSDDFYFQMYYDNLPIWGFIGKSGPLIL